MMMTFESINVFDRADCDMKQEFKSFGPQKAKNLESWSKRNRVTLAGSHNNVHNSCHMIRDGVQLGETIEYLFYTYRNC